MRFDITGPGGSLRGLSARALVKWGGRQITVTGGDGPLQLDVQVEPVAVGAIIRLTLTNRSLTSVTVQRLFPLIFDGTMGTGLDLAPGGTGPWGLYKQGYQSWSYAGWRPLGGRDIHPRFFLTRPAHADPTWPAPRAYQRGRFQSEGMVMLGRPGGGGVLLAGFTGGARQFGRFEVETSPGWPVRRLAAWCEADGYVLGPGETLAAEPLLVALAPEGEALEAYTAAVAANMHARVPERSPVVWCSWYYHFTRVRESDMLSAAAGLQGMPVDVVQLDDGYQAAVGDWLTPNDKFPHGLPWLAGQIRADGFTPGLWLAPFIAQRRSRLYQEHPDWFVHGARSCGYNPSWNDVTFGLDTTHPAVQEWLHDLIRTLVEAGFRYLKLDFLYGAAVAGRRHDWRAPRASALRTGLEVIRRAAGEDVFLMGCGSPMLPAVGLVDAMRVGPDVGPEWQHTVAGLPLLSGEPGVAGARNALRMALGRQWMHGRLWANDPDSLILRDRESRLTADEVRSLVSVAGLSGGLVSFSDPPALLSPERREWLSRVLPPTSAPVRPVTLLDQPFLSMAQAGDWLILLAYNEEKHSRPLTLPDGLAAHHVYDNWAAQYLGVLAGGGSCGEVAPHGCRVLVLRPVGDQPAAVGTSFHLNPAEVIKGSHRDDSQVTLMLSDTVRGSGMITVAGGPGGAKVTVAGAVRQEERIGPLGEVVLHITME